MPRDVAPQARSAIHTLALAQTRQRGGRGFKARADERVAETADGRTGCFQLARQAADGSLSRGGRPSAC